MEESLAAVRQRSVPSRFVFSRKSPLRSRNHRPERGLYGDYFVKRERGTSYLDAKTSRWMSADPALGEYIPGAGGDNSQLPGMGGVFNYVNMHLYHYAGNNPVKYLDPDGNDIHKAVEFLKNSDSLKPATKNTITPGLVQGIYNAEKKRMNILEIFGIDFTTIGRGQVGEAAYDHVQSRLGDEFAAYAESLGIEISGDFRTDMKNADLEDFIVAGYLSIQIDDRQQEGRSPEDAAKFGIGFYHGASGTIRDAQEKGGGDPKSFSGTESILRNGTKNQKDILNYINEVYDAR